MSHDIAYKEYLGKVKAEMDKVSPTVCLAKWKQVTLHLHNGHTHSCHHPAPHKIPLEEIAIDTSALHNTTFKKQQRELMMKGERPAECDYCWRVEDNTHGVDVFSDRITKTSAAWAKDFKDEVLADPLGNINPSHLEISFSNTCNFKCSYCSPEISSKWMEEIRQHGGYPTSTNFNNLQNIVNQNKMPILEKEFNPYVEAFWKWWPDLYNDLRVVRVTGGEPLLTKNTFKILDYIIEHPKADLELNINSNLCVPDDLVDKFIEKLKRIQGEGMVKEFVLYTSAEAHGKRAEYIRHGLDYNKWYDNCNRILGEIPNSRLSLMSTYNALSVTSFIPFLDDILKLRSTYNTGADRQNPVSIDVPYLRWPPHQSIFILTPDYLKHLEDQVTHMYLNKEQAYWPPLCGHGFYENEINKIERLYYVAKDSPRNMEEINKNRKDFALFVDEHDKRRGTDFLATFPEMEEFYKRCKQ
jgi:sulfatase maturation enzyme AslB (radical SAM superfamily)